MPLMTTYTAFFFYKKKRLYEKMLSHTKTTSGSFDYKKTHNN